MSAEPVSIGSVIGKDARGRRRQREVRPVERAETPSAKASPMRPDVQAKREQRRTRRLPFRGFPRLSWFIFGVNSLAMIALVVGIVAADRSRVRLIDARKQQLETQGRIFAEALAISALRDNSYGMRVIEGVETPIPLFDEKRADEIIRNLVLPTKTRARLFDYRGRMIIDSKLIASGGAIDRVDLAPPGEPGPIEKWVHKSYVWVSSLIPRRPRLPYIEVPPEAAMRAFPELANALEGDASSADRYSESEGLIVSVGMPVKLLKVTAGALLLTTEGEDIDEIVRRDNEATFRVVIVSFLVSLLLSLVLARSIANPIRELARSADEVASGPSGSRVAIPDFGRRHDEIGELSRSLIGMTKALYDRIEAIERFAADVSHEIKNPLTSIRSAVETLQFAKRQEDQSRLIEIVRDDVRRLDRLITDISAASRLDAELARGERDTIDLYALVRGFTETAQSTRRDDTPHIAFDADTGATVPQMRVRGHETRITQVLHNLVGNARSFSPPGGTIRLRLSVKDPSGTRSAFLTVDDEGPGIPEDNLERIFERFYTSRPDPEFGKNSGLGLSICRQIVAAHGGRIWAENRKDSAGKVIGARFNVQLPLMAVE